MSFSFATLAFYVALLCYVITGIYLLRSLLGAANLLALPKHDDTHVGNPNYDTVKNSGDTRKTYASHAFRINRSLTLCLLLVGFICHALSLLQSMVITGGDINFNLFNVFSLTALLMLGFSLLFSSFRPIIVLNVLAAPIAAFGLTLSYANPYPAHNTNINSLSTSMEWHILLSIAAYSVFLMAAMQAVLLRLQNRELKKKSKTKVWVKLLPSLQTMEALLFDMIILGFVLLTAALGLGWLGVTDLFAQHLAHKTVFSLLAWVLFAWLMFGHWKFGWRGKLAANMTLWGFGFLAMGFVGTKFVIEMVLVK